MNKNISINILFLAFNVLTEVYYNRRNFKNLKGFTKIMLVLHIHPLPEKEKTRMVRKQKMIEAG